MKHLTLHLRASILFASLLVACWNSHAQFSLNVVGYVNVVLSNGYSLLANPLQASTNDCVTNLLQYAPVGSRAYAWDITNQVFHPRALRSVSGWDTNYSLRTGRGFMVYAPLQWTNTFVGNVVQGRFTNFLAGNHGFSLVGSIIPIGGPISSVMSNAFPLLDGAVVHLFRSPIQSFSDSYTCFTNYGWFDPKGVEDTNGPNCNVAEGFVVQNPGPPTNWIGNFVANRPATSPVPTMPINRLQISGGTAILEWADPGGGGLHDIQFSTDRATWTTIATRQSGVTWTGDLPAPVAGFFQVIASNKEGRAN